MKCVKNNETLEVRRLKDSLAKELVESGKWVYTTKSAFKTYITGLKKFIVKEETKIRGKKRGRKSKKEVKK